ncbi:hypothetical protein C6497_12795 [Candidatus Poribacteria bacterium]|nr:MAG: hypothetical protein C6497_12795 [Candidatus Poribacteria bacterium]
MNDGTGKSRNPIQGTQVSQGRLNDMSEFIDEEVSDTSNWIEIYRTADEWEVKLILATLAAQQIRCRPIQVKKQRQTVLFVPPEHEVTAMELVSRIDVAIADNEVTMQSKETAEALQQRDMAAVPEENPQLTTESGETLLAHREDIGSVVHVEGQGYELRVGPEPYITVSDNDWEEFTDFSAQRQEFVMLLRHEYPALYDWIQDEKLLSEFTRLIEMTYQDGSPIPVTHRQYTESMDDEMDGTPFNGFAQLSITVAVISLLAVLFRVPWQANAVLAVVVVLSAIIAFFQIRMHAERNIEGEKPSGNILAFSAIILSCLVVLFSWWLDQRPEPDVPEKQPTREQFENR